MPLFSRLPWMVACLACLGLLLAACTRPQPPTVPLYRALQVGDLDQVKRHLYHGSDIDSPDAQGDYPLHIATAKGQTAIAQLLLEHGANLDARDAAGRTALHLALAKGRVQLAQMYLDAGSTESPQTLLFALVAEDSADRDVLALLRRRGVDFNARDETGQTPLQRAVADGRVALAKRLILAGADPNLADASGRTPLGLALKEKDADLIRMLRQYGADDPGLDGDAAPTRP
jgi:ankyrin repeat protein